MNALPIVAFIARADGSLVHASQALAAYVGRPADVLAGCAYGDVLVHDDRERASAFWEARCAAGGAFHDKLAILRADGSTRSAAMHATPLREPNGTPTAWLGTLTDIDERHDYEQALGLSEARLRAFSDAFPGLMWSADPEGRLTYISERSDETGGGTPSEGLGDGWLDFVHPEDRERTRARWAASVASGDPYETQFRVRMADGSYRWQLVRGEALRDPSGAVTRWAGINVDIQDQRGIDEAREMFVALAENSSDVIVIAERDGALRYVNAAGRALLGFGDEQRGIRLGDLFAERDRSTYTDAIVPRLEAEGRWVGDVYLRHSTTNVAIPIEMNLFSLKDAEGGRSALAMVSRDLRDRKRMERGLRLLSGAGAATVESLDYVATLENIARAVVAEFASYCIIDVLGREESVHRTAFHPDPAKKALLERLSTPRQDHPIARALKGESTVTQIDSTWPNAVRGAEDRLAAIQALDVRSVTIVPVVKPNGEIVGALTAGLDRSMPREDYGTDDLVFLEEAGRRAGAAIQNARLFERERRIAVEFQAASLPERLPQLPGIALDAEYRPGSAESLVGGDWYDAFVLADGRLAITVGDVLGHGLHAAVTMMKLRQAMQAAAMLAPEPNAMLRVADGTIRAVDPDAYATAVAAIYDPPTRTLTLATAGHPAPIRVVPGSPPSFAANGGMMLGLQQERTDAPLRFTVPPGTTLVLYTDGLTEATRNVVDGDARVLAAADSPAFAAADRPASTLVETVLAGEPARDDIAVLVVRFS